MLVERMQHFVIPVSAANVPAKLGLTQQVDLDASFRLLGVVVWNLGVPSGTGCEGQIAIRIYRPNAQQIQRQLTASNLLFPGNQYNQAALSPNKALISPIRPGVLYPAGSVITLDILGLNTGIVTPQGCIIVLVGTNIYQEGNVYNPQYPAKWKARPYLDNLTVQNVPFPGGLPKLSVPFTAQADSDFVWQAGLYSDEAVTAGTFARLLVSGEDISSTTFRAVTIGAGGNSIVIACVSNNGVPSQAFSLGVVGNTITITQATDGIGTPTTTGNQVVAAILASGPASALVTASTAGATGASVFSFADFSTNLTGGSGLGGTASIMQLIDLGVIVRDPGYKAYSNGYVPAALLFPFLSSQAPGWLYPEIYIPRLGQIYFDFNYLYAGFTPAASPVTITLGMQGMKVYPQSS
jgi:hypothetical protein